MLLLCVYEKYLCYPFSLGENSQGILLFNFFATCMFMIFSLTVFYSVINNNNGQKNSDLVVPGCCCHTSQISKCSHCT